MFHLIYCQLLYLLLISLRQILKMLQILFQHRVLYLKLIFCVYISIALTHQLSGYPPYLLCLPSCPCVACPYSTPVGRYQFLIDTDAELSQRLYWTDVVGAC